MKSATDTVYIHSIYMLLTYGNGDVSIMEEFLMI